MGVHIEKKMTTINVFLMIFIISKTLSKNSTGVSMYPLPLDPDGTDLRTRTDSKKFASYFSHLSNNILIARAARSSATMKCPAMGNPPPTIKWMKNGKIPEREFQKEIIYKRYSLKMNHLLTSDSGIYTCILVNSEGSLNRTFTLEVINTLPKKPIFKDGNLKNKTAYIGQTVKFKCEYYSYLLPRMAWVRHFSLNGSYTDKFKRPYVTRLESTNPNDVHILELANITEADETWYTCIVGNAIGISQKSAYLTVLPLPDCKNVSTHKLQNSSYLFILFTAILIAMYGGKVSGN